MLTLRRLLWLLRRPVPFPTQFFAMGCGILVVVALGEWFEAEDVLTTKIALSVGLLLVVTTGFSERVLKLSKHFPNAERTSFRIIAFGYCLWLFWVWRSESVGSLQYLLAYFFIFQAMINGMRILMLQWDKDYRAMYPTLSKAALHLHAQLSTVQPLVLAALMLLGAQQLSPTAWLVWAALIPLAIHPLYTWTVIAMWPHGAEDDD